MSEKFVTVVKKESRSTSLQKNSGSSLLGKSEPPSPCQRWPLIFLLLVTAFFLFFNLGAKYLWQDEAATAVLSLRLMKFGKPLAYDGVNLITMDHFAGEDACTIDQRTGNAEAAVRYYAGHGDFKGDTAWIGQPWGQFVAAGLSLAIFGHNTVAARLPFALAALLTVALFYGLLRRHFQDPVLAWLAAAILLANVYWVIHSRQCRYYSLSGLFLLLTLITFVNWQMGRRFGGLLFVVTAWCWFQVDFGSFWPMLGILLLAAMFAAWPRVQRVLVVSMALGAAVAPWVWYYELAGRVKTSALPWSNKFLLNLFHMNQFLIPLPLLLAAGILLVLRWRTMDRLPRLILSVSLAMLLTALVWVPSVAPSGFHRYIVHLTPLAALCLAWVVGEGAAWMVRRQPWEQRRRLLAAALTLIVVACPLLSNLVSAPLRQAVPGNYPLGVLLRAEWAVLYEEVFAPRPDPNRLTVEALKRVASAGDEILINYEDIPLMFYTDYRIRGGIPCFRVEDNSQGPPRFLVIRQSVGFVHISVFQREIQRYQWRLIPSGAPDFPWGNIPEPEFRAGAVAGREILFAENIGPAPSKKP